MKKNIFIFLFVWLMQTTCACAQTQAIGSAIKEASSDEKQISSLKELTDQQNNATVIIRYGQQGIALAKRLNRPIEQEYFLADLCRGYHKNDDYPKELETALTGLRLSQQLNDEDRICEFSMVVLISYDQGRQYDEGIGYGLMGLQTAEKTKNQFRITQLCDYISQHYMAVGHLDSALKYMRRSNHEATVMHDQNIGFSLYGLGVIQAKLHHPDSALYFYQKAVPAFKGSNIFRTANLIDAYTGIAGIYKSELELDSALYYADKAYQLSKEANQFNSTYEAAGILASLYEGKNDKESLHYYKIAAAAKDSILTADKIKQMLILSRKEEQRRQELIDSLQRRRDYLLWAIGILIVLFILVFYYRRYRLKKQMEIEKIRSNIAADFHDELGSTLSSIALYTEIAGNDDFSNMQRTRNILSQIGESSRKTISAMHDMIWSIQPNKDSMQDVICRMREYAYPLAELKKIILTFVVEKEVQDLNISMEGRKNIFLIFKEALNNAFKYSHASTITIHINKHNQLINLEIKDDGSGFDTDKISQGNGIRNMYKRAEQLGGKLFIKTGTQSGTSIVFLSNGT
jgi:signal transduction histidine kinase